MMRWVGQKKSGRPQAARALTDV